QTHENVNYYINHWSQRFAVSCSDRMTLFSSFSHDASIPDIFGALHNGAALYPVDIINQAENVELARFLTGEKITIWHSVPSLYNYFVNTLRPDEKETFPHLRFIVLGGEAVREHEIRMFQKHFPHSVLANLYGQTESTINSIWSVRPGDPIREIVIGQPLDNTELLLIDEDGDETEPLETGEIIIACPHVSPGYWGDEETTAQVFRSHPEYGRMYRTGDLGRRLLDDNIEFLGRKDFQVKIRGFRVEPGEVESQLLMHEQVSRAIVTAVDINERITRKDKKGFPDTCLCAYFVPLDGHRGKTGQLAGELRDYLSRLLPEYMVPAFFMPLDQLPLTGSGKVDRRSLPQPELNIGTHYTAPRNHVEKKMAGIWSDVLKTGKTIGIDDNFFQLGGHSLKATLLASWIHEVFDVKCPVSRIFKEPTIRGLAQFLSTAVKSVHDNIEPVEQKEYYPLSSAQKRLFFVQMLDQGSTGYNMPQVMKLEGNLDVEKLGNCLREIVRKHESLRTSFHMIDNQPVQKVHDHVEFEIEFFGRGVPLQSQQDFIRPFDLSLAPLIRSRLIRMPDAGYTWMIDMHHIVSDGTSIGLLVNEFMAIYEGREGSELTQPRLRYIDYSQWENRGKERIELQEAFWLKEFEEEIPVLNLPLDYSRPKMQQFVGALLNFDIDANHTRALNRLALERGTTLYNVLLAVYTIFLSKIGNQETIVAGTPTAGRRHAGLETIIGMFIDTLVLKNEPRGEKRFHTFLEEVNRKTLDAFANQDYHYEDLVEKVVRKRDTGRNPLFDVMLVLQNMEIPSIEIPGLKLEPLPFERSISKFDLTLLCSESEKRLWCTFEYSTALFKPRTIQRFSRYFINIISAVAAGTGPDQRIADIDILSEEEKRQLLLDFNDTAEEFPAGKTICGWIEEQAERNPDHVALVALAGQITNYKSQITNNDNASITYGQLNEKADRLARYLYHEKGIRTGHPVAVSMERSMELIIALVGVMKAGGAYVPLDPSLPPDRLRVMFNDATIGVVISQQKFIQKLTPLKNPSLCPALHSILAMDDPESLINRQPPVPPDIAGAGHPAYVMYTSGSSGTPKGVVVEHRTIVNTLIWRKNYYDYQPGDVSLRNPPYFFDSSVTDIFTPLLGGACLVLVPEEQKTDLAVLKRVIPLHNVSHLIAVPAFYNLMIEEIPVALTHVKHVCVAGEHFPDQLIRKHFDKLPQVRIHNEYGPTENSVNSTAYEIKPGSPKALIGKPISNVGVYILDPHHCLVPVGVTGEMCLAGSSLARGYLNNPEMTMERFIDMDFSHGRTRINTDNHGGGLFKIYKTGDMGKWLEDGNIEFLGRTDTQVK
ncbi:MAG: amino acid adenylation domain-containing protein, partial [bacterium]|nr:amino acid adenylation domain-containing protein [bacterium]